MASKRPCFDGKQRTPREPKNCNPGALGCRILSKLNGIFLNKLISEKIVDCSNCNGFCGCVCGSKKCVCPHVRRKKCPMTACLLTAKGCLLTSHIQYLPNDLCKTPGKGQQDHWVLCFCNEEEEGHTTTTNTARRRTNAKTQTLLLSRPSLTCETPQTSARL